jgi:hypothetical protein
MEEMVVLVAEAQRLLVHLEQLDQVVLVRNLLNLEFQDRLVLEMLVEVLQMLVDVLVVVAAEVVQVALELPHLVVRLKLVVLEKRILFLDLL